MKNFPQFRSLPLVPKELVFRFVSKEDIFNYSLISKKSRNFVKSLKTKVTILKWELNDPNRSDKEALDCIALSFNNDWNLCFYLIPMIEKNWMEKKNRGERVRKVNEIQVIFGRETGVMINSNASSDQLIRVFCDYFQEMFHVDNFSLRSWQAPEDLFLPYILGKKRFVTLELYSNYEEEEEEYKVSPELLKILLKDVEVTWKFELRIPVDGDFKYHNPLEHVELRVQEATWLTIDCLIDMKCRVLEATGTLITAQEIRMFIGKWLEGGYETLETLILWNNGTNYEDVCNGLFSFVEWERPRIHGRNDCKEGHDIRRSDGLMATIQAKAGRFKFLVWQPKFLK